MFVLKCSQFTLIKQEITQQLFFPIYYILHVYQSFSSSCLYVKGHVIFRNGGELRGKGVGGGVILLLTKLVQ